MTPDKVQARHDALNRLHARQTVVTVADLKAAVKTGRLLVRPGK